VARFRCIQRRNQMKFAPFSVKTRADLFDAWMRNFAQNRSLSLKVHCYQSSRRRYELMHAGETVIEVDMLPTSPDELEVQVALRSLSSADDCSTFFQRVSKVYKIDVSLPLGLINSAPFRFLYVEQPRDDPEKEAKRQMLIAALWEGLPPVTEPEVTQHAQLSPPKVIPKTPATRLKWSRRYQEALLYIRRGDSVEQAAKKLGLPSRSLREIVAWGEWNEHHNSE
jgi:hypothetical protein